MSSFDIAMPRFLTMCSYNPLFILKFHFLVLYVAVSWLLCSGELQLSCASVFILEIFWLLMHLIFCFVTIWLTGHSSSLYFFFFSSSPYFAVWLSVLPGVTGSQMHHNIGFSSAFHRNQSRLCDLCR